MSDIPLKNEADRNIYQSMQAYESTLVQAHMGVTAKYAALALQGSFVLNGTVGIAAFTSPVMKSYWPVACCAAGAVFAVIAAILACIGQFQLFSRDISYHYGHVCASFARSVERKESICRTIRVGPTYQTKIHGPRNIPEDRSNIYLVFSLASVVLSVVGFCVGLFLTLQAYVEA